MDIWEGACLDTGAQKTVCGKAQAKAYCQSFGVTFKLRACNHRFRFGTQLHQAIGQLQIRIPVGKQGMIPLSVDIIEANIPFLIGIDVMDKYKFYVNTVSNELICPSASWKVPLTRKFGHVYLEWNPKHEILFTKSELIKIHRGFHHPSTDKLYNILKRADPNNLTSHTRQILQQISKTCDTCQRFGPRPIRFKVTLPSDKDLVFGSELSMDLMFIDGKALLHIVDTATRFSAAIFLDKYGHSTNGIWNAFIDSWCTLYTGYPDRIKCDAGSAFNSKEWKGLNNMIGANISISGVEAHNSLGLGERLHAPLRRIFFKVQADHPSLKKELLLKIAVKAMNDTIGEDGLVPSLLVFGIVPRFPIMGTTLPNQKTE